MCDPRTQGGKSKICYFKVSLDYRASSRPPPGLPGKSLSQKKRKEDKYITLMLRTHTQTHGGGRREESKEGGA